MAEPTELGKKVQFNFDAMMVGIIARMGPKHANIGSITELKKIKEDPRLPKLLEKFFILLSTISNASDEEVLGAAKLDILCRDMSILREELSPQYGQHMNPSVAHYMRWLIGLTSAWESNVAQYKDRAGGYYADFNEFKEDAARSFESYFVT